MGGGETRYVPDSHREQVKIQWGMRKAGYGKVGGNVVREICGYVREGGRNRVCGVLGRELVMYEFEEKRGGRVEGGLEEGVVCCPVYAAYVLCVGGVNFTTNARVVVLAGLYVKEIAACPVALGRPGLILHDSSITSPSASAFTPNSGVL